MLLQLNDPLVLFMKESGISSLFQVSILLLFDVESENKNRYLFPLNDCHSAYAMIDIQGVPEKMQSSLFSQYFFKTALKPSKMTFRLMRISYR